MLPIPSHAGYFADRMGNVYSSWSNAGIKDGKFKKLKSRQGSSGYLFLNLRSGTIRHSIGVNRLICMTFNGLPKDKDTASHLNGNKLDNRAENLKWESLSDNHKRKVEHGTDDKGFRNSRAKINEAQYKKVIKLLDDGILTHEKIGNLVGVNRVFITKINTGLRYMMK